MRGGGDILIIFAGQWIRRIEKEEEKIIKGMQKGLKIYGNEQSSGKISVKGSQKVI